MLFNIIHNFLVKSQIIIIMTPKMAKFINTIYGVISDFENHICGVSYNNKKFDLVTIFLCLKDIISNNKNIIDVLAPHNIHDHIWLKYLLKPYLA